ncbi:MAG: helix-turn-helix domain-containing protein [Gemmatimonadales bacterium]
MTLSSRATLEVLASPARQELISQLAVAPATVAELALALGRTRQSLYYHLETLEKAGLVKGAGWRGEGRSRERIFQVAVHELVLGPNLGVRQERELAARAAAAMLRLTGREFRDALADPRIRREGPGRELAAMRGKARLTARELARLNALFREIYELLAGARCRRRGRIYSVAVVVTPSRQGED